MERNISEKENMLHILKRDASPGWVPITNDCYKTVVPSVIHERPPFGTDGDDWFGCTWLWDANCFGFAPEVRKAPLLDDINNWREVIKFPNLDEIDWKAAAEKDLADYDPDKQLLRILLESGPFERVSAMLGFQEAFLAMYEEPEEFKALIDAIADYKVQLINKVSEYYKPDDFMVQDDLGNATGPMMSLNMYRELLKPAHQMIGDAIRANGVFYTHHSCGKMEIFIDDLIDVGVQMINPLQPLNDQVNLAKKYADKVAFEVGAETLANYESSTEEEIRQDVRRIIDTFGPQKNLALTCFPSNAKCLHNVEIVFDEAKQYGGSFYY
ncbi:uroporphyrinogen decarboxylase family protein [Eubacteriaceae bacterium ES2]|nr:uroporphyrinogen decarboxylase family protein [Eubacteriaceae bacterium ES2]